MQPIVVVIGTRPEAIKMIPVYFALRNAGYSAILCSTGQHNELLTQIFDLFGVAPDISFNVMRPDQDLAYLTQEILQKSYNFFHTIRPKLVLVQGDTTTAMAAALAAWYLKIPIGHVEAGLRTYDFTAPFPEEMNRRFLSLMATYHFAPTNSAVQQLQQEKINADYIFCTGNTVVDALHIMQEQIAHNIVVPAPELTTIIKEAKHTQKPCLLFTMHRRESYNGGLEVVFETLQKLVTHHDVVCIYPYHPNPVIMQALTKKKLHELPNLYLCPPLSYQNLVYALTNCDLVMTDSGGIQEEAISLGKTTLILREKTERMEGVYAGIAHLVGTNPDLIFARFAEWKQHAMVKLKMHTNVYGDGHAAQKIVEIISKVMPKVDSSREKLCVHEQMMRVTN